MSDSKSIKFVTAGTCCPTSHECEVALVLGDDHSILLYACKHRLSAVSEFFYGLFNGEFKEKYQKQVEIRETSADAMLLFLECACEQQVGDLKPLPFDATICDLIDLADRFLCQLLKDRLLDHLRSPIMGSSAADEVKEAILETADKHRLSCIELLEASIRLCATIPVQQIAELRNKVGLGTYTALFVLCARVYSFPPFCPQCKHHETKVDYRFSYYHVWTCPKCKWTASYTPERRKEDYGGKYDALGRPAPVLEEFSEFEIDREMLIQQ